MKTNIPTYLENMFIHQMLIFHKFKPEASSVAYRAHMRHIGTYTSSLEVWPGRPFKTAILVLETCNRSQNVRLEMCKDLQNSIGNICNMT